MLEKTEGCNDLHPLAGTSYQGKIFDAVDVADGSGAELELICSCSRPWEILMSESKKENAFSFVYGIQRWLNPWLGLGTLGGEKDQAWNILGNASTP